MPTKNAAFQGALNADLSTKADAIDALNALIQANHTDANAFRKAIIDHHAVWAPHLDGTENLANDDDLRAGGDDGAGNDDARNNFAALYRNALEQRMRLSLAKAKTAQLEAIAIAADQTAVRNVLVENGRTAFGAPPQVPLHNWNPADENSLTNEQINRLKAEAQQELLVRKIKQLANAAKTPTAKTALKTKLDALFTAGNNDGQFQNAVRDLYAGHPNVDDIADPMTAGLRDGIVAREAAKQGILISVAAMTATELRTNALATLNINDRDIFRGRFPHDHCAAQLHQDDMAEIKGLLGANFLNVSFATAPAPADIDDRVDDLTRVAASTDITFKNALHGMAEVGGDDAYVDEVVKIPRAVDTLRQTAARRALKLRIAESINTTTLDELIDASNAESIKRILKSRADLGFSTNSQFRDAFFDDSIADIVAVAHIRRKIAADADPDNLKLLIQGGPHFPNNYVSNFVQGTKPDLVRAINSYFQNPSNVATARGRALISYAKAKFAEPGFDPTILTAFVDAANEDNVRDAAERLLGDDTAENLLEDGDFAAGLFPEIRAYAAAQQEIIASRAVIDLSAGAGDGNYNALIAKINDGAAAGLGMLMGDAEGLPLAEKQNVQAHLVEQLIKNYPGDPNQPTVPVAGRPANAAQLADLAKAKDLAGFKTALALFNITDTDWATNGNRKEIQRQACIRAILNGHENPRYGIAVHPKFQELIKKLPLEKLQDLLEKPGAIIALTTMQKAEDLNYVLGAKHGVAGNVIADLAVENQRLAKFSRIANLTIAKKLLSVAPPINLSETQVNEINEHLLANNDPFSNNPNPGSPFSETIHNIARIVNRNNEVFVAFGLDNAVPFANSNITDDTHRQAVLASGAHNQTLIDNYSDNNTSIKDKAILSHFASLSKTADIVSNAEVVNLLTDFKNSNTPQEFFEKAFSAAPLPGYAAAFDEDTLKKELSYEVFTAIKTNASKTSFLHVDGCREEIVEQTKQMKEREQLFSEMKLDRSAKNNLSNIGKKPSTYWFSPAFGALAKENANVMAPEYREMARVCNITVTHLESQLLLINNQLNSLPKPGEVDAAVTVTNAPGATADTQAKGKEAIKKQIENRIKKLEKQKTAVNAELEHYKPIQLLLNGDPAATHPQTQQGILKTLEQAEADQNSMTYVDFNSGYKDYSLSELDSHLKKGWKGQAVPTTSVPQITSNGTHERFSQEDKPAAGMFREVTIHHEPQTNPTTRALEPVTSCFIIKHAENETVTKPDGNSTIKPNVTIIANGFPDPSKPEGVEYAMGVAIEILSRLKEYPSEKNPVGINGAHNKEQTKLLCHAFLYLAEKDPTIKIPKEAIKIVASGGFNLNDEEFTTKYRGKVRTGPGTVFERFDNNSRVQSIIEGVKDIEEKKHGKTTTSERAAEMKMLQKFGQYKNKKDEIYKKLEQENTAHAQNMPVLGG